MSAGAIDGGRGARRPSTNITTGRQGEDIAAAWLTAAGMSVLERNWRCRDGEVDIVAIDADVVVLVEVKTRRGPIGGHPFEAITPQKVARLRRLASRWVAEHPADRPRRLRLDAVAVRMHATGEHVEHIRGIV
ncbi:YraN family protein [Curtobacterium sp. RRHDQ10]|uniref:YraN family protein n=1 Tax=Curtobacterium phyllosphaerae TaxID=3413379 RepID=UPI003BF2BD1F